MKVFLSIVCAIILGVCISYGTSLRSDIATWLKKPVSFFSIASNNYQASDW